MLIRTIKIKGIPPSKKNSKEIRFNKKTAKRFIGSSDSFKNWEEGAMWEYATEKKISGKVHIHMIFYPKDKRRHDCTNVAEGILDLFVKLGVIEEDNWFILQNIVLSFGEIDEKNPRVEMNIYDKKPIITWE